MEPSLANPLELGDHVAIGPPGEGPGGSGASGDVEGSEAVALEVAQEHGPRLGRGLDVTETPVLRVPHEDSHTLGDLDAVVVAPVAVAALLLVVLASHEDHA